MKITPNSITNISEAAVSLQSLSKANTGKRDNYLLEHEGVSLNTFVRHAKRAGLEIRLFCPRTDTAFFLEDDESAEACVGYLFSELKGSFVLSRDYVRWVRENRIPLPQMTVWKNGYASPKLDFFIKVAVEELGYEMKLINHGALG